MSNEVKQITKRSGEKAPFNEQKLKHSLERTGAGELEIQKIIFLIIRKILEILKLKIILWNHQIKSQTQDQKE